MCLFTSFNLLELNLELELELNSILYAHVDVQLELCSRLLYIVDYE